MQQQVTKVAYPDDARDNSEIGNPSIFDGYITEAEYARQRSVSVRTCQRDRALRQAPPHVILGKRVFYRIDAVRAWLEVQERSVDRHTGGRRPARKC